MSIRKYFWVYVLSIVLILFLIKFISEAYVTMVSVPFNEFDEAHQSETAKRMKELHSYFVPVSGSPYDKVQEVRVVSLQDRFKFFYYHLERPPLIYDLMILSTTILGSREFSYRLPSFLFGMLSVVVFVVFSKPNKGSEIMGFFLGLTCLVTSVDLWLSSQYAQLDTGLTAFLFIALLSLITYVESKQEKFLILSGISFSLAILAKGQPAIVLLPAVLFLIVSKRLSWKSFLRFSIYSAILLVPWVLYVGSKFGLLLFLETFGGFSFTTVRLDVAHHKAPFIWYVRWWWETLRPGWTLFLAFLAIDFFSKSIDWKRWTLIVYVLGNFIWLSALSDKLWWYVLPLVPAVCFYVYLSSSKYISKNSKLVNIALCVVIASRPPLFGATNTIAMFYGIVFTILVVLLLTVFKFSNAKFGRVTSGIVRNISYREILFVGAIWFCLFSFYTRFPKIIPYHYSIKPVSTYFSLLPEPKCLWVYDIPAISVLFYSESIETYPFTAGAKPYGHCSNYLITANKFPHFRQEYKVGRIRLYKF